MLDGVTENRDDPRRAPDLTHPPRSPRQIRSRRTWCCIRSNILPGQRRVRRGESSDGHAERRAGDVVEAASMAEGDRTRVTAVLTADTDLQLRLCATAALDGDPHELADAGLV